MNKYDNELRYLALEGNDPIKTADDRWSDRLKRDLKLPYASFSDPKWKSIFDEALEKIEAMFLIQAQNREAANSKLGEFKWKNTTTKTE